MVAIQLLYCSLAIPILRSFIWENEEFDMPTTVFVSSEGCQGRFDRNRPWRPGSSGSQVSETGIRQTRSQGFLLVVNSCTLKREPTFYHFYLSTRFIPFHKHTQRYRDLIICLKSELSEDKIEISL